jgi:DNA-binding NarL/FixJ family response regulator
MSAPFDEPGDVRVVVVDDHPVFRLGLAALLDSLAGVTVTGQAAGAAQARALLSTDLDVDVVLMDVDLGDGSGIDVTQELLRRRPEVRVLVLSMHEDDDTVAAAVRAGARGYLVKTAPPDAVERAVRAVAAGDVILAPAVAERALAYVLGGHSSVRVPFPRLTDREREVLDLVAAGHDNAAISRRLYLSPKTVRNHVANVLTKLEVPDRSALIVRARKEGLGGP